MIIYNTTYSVNLDAIDEFLEWLRKDLIPAATASGELSKPQLALILANAGDKSRSYSLQFQVPTVDDLQAWYHGTGMAKVKELETRFANRVVGFSTIMTIIDTE